MPTWLGPQLFAASSPWHFKSGDLCAWETVGAAGGPKNDGRSDETRCNIRVNSNPTGQLPLPLLRPSTTITNEYGDKTKENP